MSDILRTSLAPINDAAWSEIRAEAETILKGNLSARRIVDVDGPHGWTCASVNLGRLQPLDKEPVSGVKAGVRQVLPLVEVRVPFSLDIWELDNAERGAEDIELGPVTEAARKISAFEEGAVYGGFPEGCIQGLLEKSPHKPIALGASPEALIEAVEAGILALQEEGIGGPYALVLDTETYARIEAGLAKGYPVRRQIEKMTEGGMYWSPAVATGALISKRGGDFALTLGQDISIGYQGHGNGKVDLYLTESLTFRVLEPAAAVALHAKG